MMPDIPPPPESASVPLESVVNSIRSNAKSVQTARNYVDTMNAVARVCAGSMLGHALVRDCQTTFEALKHASSNLKPITLKNRITGIMGAFKMCDALKMEDTEDSAWKFWDEIHRDMLAAARVSAQTNIASPSQIDNMVTLEQILAAARSLTHDTVKQSQDKVLMTLAALVPAKRADWARLRIVDLQDAVDKDENGLVVSPTAMTLVLNVYKTARAYGRHVEEINGEPADVIRTSLATHPRAFLFVSPARPGGMSNDAFQTYFSGTFDRHMRKHVTINLLRHIWVTERIDPRRMTVLEMDEVARKMLHGLGTQRMYFLVTPPHEG